MKLKNAKILLTGANGGIGSAIAELLVQRGATVALFARDLAGLDRLQTRLRANHADADVYALGTDLLDSAARKTAVQNAVDRMGGIDVVINCAGLQSFKPFADEDPDAIERLMQLNLIAPTMIIRQLLPEMLAKGSGHIVNVGSTFGTIGFAWFAAYSASKFGLRGLSESLRRELDGTGVKVTYVAPRGVKTALNTDSVYRMAQSTKMHMDEPAWVAQRIVEAIERDAKDVYLGFPEKFFARLNSFLPRLVDNGLRKQNQIMAPFARGEQ